MLFKVFIFGNSILGLKFRIITKDLKYKFKIKQTKSFGFEKSGNHSNSPICFR